MVEGDREGRGRHCPAESAICRSGRGPRAGPCSRRGRSRGTRPSLGQFGCPGCDRHAPSKQHRLSRFARQAPQPPASWRREHPQATRRRQRSAGRPSPIGGRRLARYDRWHGCLRSGQAGRPTRVPASGARAAKAGAPLLRTRRAGSPTRRGGVARCATCGHSQCRTGLRAVRRSLGSLPCLACRR